MKNILVAMSCVGLMLAPTAVVNAQTTPRTPDSEATRERNRPRDDRFNRERAEGRRGEGRGWGGPGGMQARNNAHFQLGRLWRGIGELENSATPLSKSQSAQIVTLMRPWSSRPQMSEDEAQKLDGQLRAILTTAQKGTVDERRGNRRGGPEAGQGDGEGKMRGRGRRGDGPAAYGRNGGGPREGEPRGRGGRGKGRGADFDPQKMATVRAALANRNPFYAPTGLKEWKELPERMQQRMADRYKDNRGILEALSRKSKN